MGVYKKDLMPTQKEIQDFARALQANQMRFLRDLNVEELVYLADTANNYYEETFEPVQTNKLRLISDIQNPSNLREKRIEGSLFKLFEFMNELAAMSDRDIARLAEENLWAVQDIYSRESALVQDIIARLARSEGKELPKIEKDESEVG